MSRVPKTGLRTKLRTAEALRRWVYRYTGAKVPAVAVCPGHQAPLEYLWAAYREPAEDLVVWAPRGGGKTRLGAIATLLDLLHKPGVSVRILGGSADQSLRMWEHLLPAVEEVLPADEFCVRARSIRLESGSAAAVLAQSQRSVRGQRVQKMRCDELDLFDPGVWSAAQLVTRSLKDGDELTAAGTVDAFSTYHRTDGLMGRAVDDAARLGRRVIRWCLLDVLEQCPPERVCGACGLLDDCHGVAKASADGFVTIDDAIAMKRRVSRGVWESEMLCRRPSVRDAVFPGFDRGVHVREIDVAGWAVSLAIDFGFANPLVCLWVAGGPDGRAYVIDEYVQPARTLWEHLDEIEARPWKAQKRIACDPAGSGRNDQTAESNVQLLRRRGYRVSCRGSRIVEGLEVLRAMLTPALGEPTLSIHPRCTRLIAAMEHYRYPHGGGELPVKDGTHDHPIDALRYWAINADRQGVGVRVY